MDLPEITTADNMFSELASTGIRFTDRSFKKLTSGQSMFSTGSREMHPENDLRIHLDNIVFDSLTDGNHLFNGCNNDEYNSDRNDSNYYEQTYRISSNWIKDNIDKEQQMFGNQYINIMASIMFKDGTYPVFTPDHKFFSHDGIHLTKAGARRFAQVLNISKYISLENKVKR